MWIQLIVVVLFLAALIYGVMRLLRNAKQTDQFVGRMGKAKSAIAHYKDGWYWWNEVWTDRYGPYKHKVWAQAACSWYAWLALENGHAVGTAFRYRRVDHKWVLVRLTEVMEDRTTDPDCEGLIYVLKETGDPAQEHTVDVNLESWQHLMVHEWPTMPECNEPDPKRGWHDMPGWAQ